MNRALARYLNRLLLQRSLGALLAVLGVLQVLDLMDATDDLLARSFGFVEFLRYMALRAPSMIQQTAPLAALIGALLTFAQLARGSEVIAIRATGTPIYKIVLIMLPAASVVAVIHLVAAEFLAPPAERTLTAWMRDTRPASQPAPKAKPAWFRIDGEVVEVERWADGGRTLSGVHIYDRNQANALTLRTTADTARWNPAGGWTLNKVVVTRIGTDSAADQAVASQRWGSTLTPDEVVGAFSPNLSISAADAWPRLHDQAPAVKPPAFYRTRLWRTVAGPLAALVMLILAASAGLGGTRNGQAGRLMVYGLASGVLFLVVDGFLTTLGQVNVFPSFVGAWAAPFLFAAGGAMALLTLEG
jgi:lipopolysaccharide export system permease protein